MNFKSISNPNLYSLALNNPKAKAELKRRCLEMRGYLPYLSRSKKTKVEKLIQVYER